MDVIIARLLSLPACVGVDSSYDINRATLVETARNSVGLLFIHLNKCSAPTHSLVFFNEAFIMDSLSLVRIA